MKRLMLIAILTLLPVLSSSAQYVNGYTRRDGTYVSGHYRSDSNSTTSDNYSTYGNSNPYTGEKGYKHY